MSLVAIICSLSVRRHRRIQVVAVQKPRRCQVLHEEHRAEDDVRRKAAVRESCLRRGTCCRSAGCRSCDAPIRPTCRRSAARRPRARASRCACPALLRRRRPPPTCSARQRRPTRPSARLSTTPRRSRSPRTSSAPVADATAFAASLSGLRVIARSLNPLPASARAVAPPCFPVAPVMRTVRSFAILDSSTLDSRLSTLDSRLWTLQCSVLINFIASAIIDPTSATLAGSTIVLLFFASSPN